MCSVRRASEEDVGLIRDLVRSAGVHSPGSGKEKAGREQMSLLGGILSKVFAPIFTSGIKWRNCYVAVSEEGSVVGCVQLKPHAGDIFEFTSFVVHRKWRDRGIAIALCEHVVAQGPRPQWGTCTSDFIPFYRKFGAVEVTDSGKMPRFLRRRRRWFNIFLRLARKKEYLAVMVLE